MASYFTSTTLIDSICRKAAIPREQSTFTDEDLLAFADEETTMGVVPSMLKLHEEFYVYTILVPLEENVTSYPIPDRAMGVKLRSVFYLDNNQNLQDMARINPDDVIFYQNRSSGITPRAFYFENDNIVLVPGTLPNPQGSLQVKIFIRPNQLVPDNQVASIEAIDTTTGIVTLTEIPTAFNPSLQFDFIERNRGHKCKAIDVSSSNVNTMFRTMSFSPGDIPSDLRVGDMIAIAGQTCIPQMPDDFHAVLAQRSACRCLEAQKDTEGLKNAYGKLKEMEENIGVLVDNRAEGSPQKVNNLRGLLRAGKYNSRRGYT